MAIDYTEDDLRKKMESDPQHGEMWAFVWKAFKKGGNWLSVRPLGIVTKWDGTGKEEDPGAARQVIIVDSGASDIATAAEWAKNGFREWAHRGIQDPANYFALLARDWALSQKASCTKCLGSTVDFLYLLSGKGWSMYPINSATERDLKAILLWVFVGWWGIEDMLLGTMDHDLPKIDQSDLHPDYHDSGAYNEDQTHHFAFYFYVGMKIGSFEKLLVPFLKKTNDLDDDGNIINAGDYYLGLTAARLGDDFDNRPRFIGAEITSALQHCKGWSPPKATLGVADLCRLAGILPP